MISDKLPKEYQGTVLNDIDNALKVMIPTLDLVEQTNTSMTWAIPEEEKNLGLIAAGDDDIRRESIHAKWLSQFDATGLSDIVKIIMSFGTGEVEADYVYPIITVTFVSILGAPKNISSIKMALREVVPAHIAINYIYVYRTNAAVGKYTHQQLHAYTHYNIREGELTIGN